MITLLIGLGGALGAACRYIIGTALAKDKIINGTWIVNISGSFIIGVLANLYVSNQLDEWVWAFFGIGFCGAFTTFSTFSMESIQWIQNNQFKKALIYVVSSVLIGIISATIGYFL